MRVACCISGLMRTYKDVYKTLIEHVIIPNKADLFISTWDIVGLSTYKYAYKKPPEEPLTEEMVRSVYGDHLKSLNIEQWALQPKFVEEVRAANKIRKIDMLPPQRQIVMRLASMHYKLKDANRLRQEYEFNNNFSYDVVIRGRPDIKHEKKVDVSVYDITYPNIYTDKIHNYSNVCDQFALGSPAVMDIYCGMYPDILKYHENNRRTCHAEFIMKYHLTKHNIHVNQVNFGYKLIGLKIV